MINRVFREWIVYTIEKTTTKKKHEIKGTKHDLIWKWFLFVLLDAFIVDHYDIYYALPGWA